MYIAAACHSFVQSSDGSHFCCVELAWLRMIMMCHFLSISWSKIETQQGEGGRADSWWNPQRTKGFATHLIISDHLVWFIMVCMLVCHIQIIIFHQIRSSRFACWFTLNAVHPNYQLKSSKLYQIILMKIFFKSLSLILRFSSSC